MLLNPPVLALAAGVVLYALPLTLPELLRRPVSALAACNAPVAMIILGGYLTEIPLHQVFTEKSAWRVSLLRLLVIPALSALALAWLPALGAEAKTALIIAAGTPVGINVAVYTELLERDNKKAVILICHSSVLCLLTMPLVQLLMQALLR